MLWRLAKALVPAAIREGIRRHQRQSVFGRSLRRLVEWPGHEPVSLGLLQAMSRGWNNEGYSLPADSLRALHANALDGKGDIVECGSGLTTLLFGAATAGTGRQVVSLEHIPAWAERVRGAIARTPWDHVQVLDRPLRHHHSFEWYGVEPESLPSAIGLLFIDGPPSHSDGGRIGALRLLRPALGKGSVIILDDWDQPSGQRAIRAWSDEFGVNAMPFDQAGRMARIVLPEQIRRTPRPQSA